MITLRVNDVLKDKILVSRESAHELAAALQAGLAGERSGQAMMLVDFDGVQGVTPSFVDELLSIFESLVGRQGNGEAWQIVIGNPPTRLSLKFQALARGHGMSAQVQSDGSWLLRRSNEPAE